MLDDTNIYKKSYKTYSITNTEQKYKLVIFPSDNTFSIVNNKQCSNSEHYGLITVQSGSTMAELHEAQKLLGKAMNTDIESDYDPEQENKMKTKATTIVKLQSKEPTITSLSDIPFGGLGNNACEDLRLSPQRQHSKRTKATNIKSKRQYISSKKPSNQTTPSSSSISILQTPKPLAGRKILGTNDDNEQPSQKELVFLLKQSLLSITNIEEKYLKQILIEQERQENMIQMLFENQKKYKKPCIYIPLEEPNVEQPVEEKTFETIMMYKNPNDGNDVDLLSITGVKQKMNLYVTSLIYIVFTREELLQIDATKIKFNDGYKLIQVKLHILQSNSDFIIQSSFSSTLLSRYQYQQERLYKAALGFG
ncbi:unnamed protein product [Rotaria sordida]|uniref:Uncharacterized protein n=2 Tax=Rotaria sordida TaxID=392033 RepID=A0A814X0P5_9BILA|nr:unnamed protein product [Rotaria sordida]